MVSRNPEIKLTFDEVELCKSPKQLRHTAPYVWIVMLAGRDGCCGAPFGAALAAGREGEDDFLEDMSGFSVGYVGREGEKGLKRLRPIPLWSPCRDDTGSTG